MMNYMIKDHRTAPGLVIDSDGTACGGHTRRWSLASCRQYRDICTGARSSVGSQDGAYFRSS